MRSSNFLEARRAGEKTTICYRGRPCVSWKAGGSGPVLAHLAAEREGEAPGHANEILIREWTPVLIALKTYAQKMAMLRRRAQVTDHR